MVFSWVVGHWCILKIMGLFAKNMHLIGKFGNNIGILLVLGDFVVCWICLVRFVTV
jgi:hypothetical protein